MMFKGSSCAVILLLLVNARAQQDLKQLAKANNDVGLALLKTFPARENVFFSPASIYIALAMAYAGAREGTATEMSQALEYSKAGLNDDNIHPTFQSLLNSLSSGSDEYKLQIANAVLSQIDYKILSEYKELLLNSYKALSKEVDFAGNSQQALNELNSWVSEKTNGKISQLLDSLDPNTRMILLNAIYFKGTWKKTFNENSTKNEPFYNHGVNQVSVPMMSIQEVFPYRSFPDKGFQAVELPYKGEDVSMVILLPDKRDQLDQIEKSINDNELNGIIKNLYRIKVNLKLPKFKKEDKRYLKGSLQSLGMREAFAGQADFSGITGAKDLVISDVVHKAVIEVNEEGSEAAAVTGVIFLLKSSLSVRPTPNFIVNRPFLFFIRDRRTNMILFAGRINSL